MTTWIHMWRHIKWVIGQLHSLLFQPPFYITMSFVSISLSLTLSHLCFFFGKALPLILNTFYSNFFFTDKLKPLYINKRTRPCIKPTTIIMYSQYMTTISKRCIVKGITITVNNFITWCISSYGTVACLSWWDMLPLLDHKMTNMCYMISDGGPRWSIYDWSMPCVEVPPPPCMPHMGIVAIITMVALIENGAKKSSCSVSSLPLGFYDHSTRLVWWEGLVLN